MNPPQTAAEGRPGTWTTGQPDPGVFLGRETETARLRAALEGGTGLAIWGPADSGKTALVRHTLAQLPRDSARSCIHLPLAGPPHAVLCRLLEEMHARGDGFLAGKFHVDGGRGEEFSHWAARQTSLRLRGLLYRAAEAGRYQLILDGAAGLSDAFTRIVKELASMRETPVHLVSHTCTEEDLGRGARLYWNEDLRLGLGALPVPSARALVEHCIRRFGLSRLQLEGFREGMLRLSGRLPGAIVKMCARAGDAQYHFGGRVETRLLHVDYMMQFSYRPRRAAASQAAYPAAAPASAARGRTSGRK